MLLVVEAHIALELGRLPVRGAAAGLLGGALGGGRGRGGQAGGELSVDPAEGGGVCVDSGLLVLGGGHCGDWIEVVYLVLWLTKCSRGERESRDIEWDMSVAVREAWLVFVSVCSMIALRSLLTGQEAWVMLEKRGQHVK